MIAPREQHDFLGAFDLVQRGENPSRRTGFINQTNAHEHRAFNPVSEIHYVIVATCLDDFGGILSFCPRIPLWPTWTAAHLRPGKVAASGHIRHGSSDSRVKTRSHESLHAALAGSGYQ